jgi:hypothetical protein
LTAWFQAAGEAPAAALNQQSAGFVPLQFICEGSIRFLRALSILTQHPAQTPRSFASAKSLRRFPSYLNRIIPIPSHFQNK